MSVRQDNDKPRWVTKAGENRSPSRLLPMVSSRLILNVDGLWCNPSHRTMAWQTGDDLIIHQQTLEVAMSFGL